MSASGTVEVGHRTGDLFEISVRDHLLLVDQPVADGGSDEAPTPTELFVASLAGCVAFYARRYLARHGIDPAGFSVSADFTMEQRPARVGAVRLSVAVPAGIPDDRRDAFLAVVGHCTVHNSLQQPPAVHIDVL